MAGSLPGVEAARRRRFHQSNLISYGSEISPTPSGSTRRSSFCLYASSYDYHLSATSFLQRHSVRQKIMCDESRLGAAAIEAKKRLDERLQPQRRSDSKRTINTQQSCRSSDGRRMIQPDLQTEMPELLKRSGLKRLKWLTLGWKWSEQEECAVCLEQYKATRRDRVMHLGCGHKFHVNCLVPWLEGNAHCPCCRMEIPSSN